MENCANRSAIANAIESGGAFAFENDRARGQRCLELRGGGLAAPADRAASPSVWSKMAGPTSNTNLRDCFACVTHANYQRTTHH